MYLGYLFGRYKPSERAIPIRADDIFVVSFFKSGNTWTRFLLANLLNPGRPVSFESIERTFPDIYQFQYQDYAKLPSPRVIKSHEWFDPRYRRIVYIVRDPRDVAILLYHFLRKIKTIDDTFPLETYASDWFIRGKGSGRNLARACRKLVAESKNLFRGRRPIPGCREQIYIGITWELAITGDSFCSCAMKTFFPTRMAALSASRPFSI
jgi:Sulfotransferase domain